MADKIKFPAFEDLPKVKDMPQGCMWGFWDKDGERDVLGTLNMLTAENTLQVSKAEIRTGHRIQLDWALNNVQFPGYKRKPLDHTVFAIPGFYALDDEIHLNTQCGSQWDGLKHVAHQASGKYYNGLDHETALNTKVQGIDQWCKRGGIAARGVLVDWARWWEETKSEPLPAPCTDYSVPVSDLDAVLKWQGTELKPGDIFLVRFGFVRWHDGADATTRKAGTMDQGSFIGVKGCEETVRWFYEKHFAAVGGDTFAFEQWLPKDVMMHEWFLTHWGTPIGEMWDLESLSKHCAAQKRWSFMLTSAPLNIEGGVGSPPGAIAMF